MPTWNPQQRKAIETKHKNVLVSASAGAGKTTVLIARLVDLVLKERIGIDHILAMTFTEAAANEMKKRLASELHKLYETTTEETERQYILEQLTAIQTAHISTIHSFCLSILQKFYYMIGLSSTAVNQIMDDGTAAQAKAAAMEAVFAKQYELQEESFTSLCMMFSARAENNDALQQAIMQLAANASAQSDPDRWLNACAQLYRTYDEIHELPAAIRQLFFHDLQIQMEVYESACKTILQKYQKQYMDETKKYELMERKCAAIPALFSALSKESYSLFREQFIFICHIVVPTTPDKEDTQYDRLRKQIQELEDRLLYRLFEESTLLKDIERLSSPIQKLIEMCREYRSAFAQYKRDAEMIDFDDMEHFALQILNENGGQIAKHYQELFDEIMVDEFQDSNDVQNELVNLICRNNNVFRVGDIKQSIYGFRHAKPQLMRGLITNAGPLDEVIYLSNNYRSKKMIVDFNNELFKELMNLDGFSCSYAKEDDVETGVPAQNEGNVPIVFHAIDAASIKEEEGRIFSANELKASYIALQIIAIKEEERRSWKDFVVLVRANARKQDLRQVFEELHIPYFIDVRTGFYESNAVQIMISNLHALMDPYDEIHFIAALTSPLYQVSISEIADLKLAKGKDSYYAYMKAIQHLALEVFEQLRSMLFHSSICDVLNALYETNSYYQYHTNVQERTNLDLLYETGADFEQKAGQGMIAFLKEIDALADADSGEAIPIGSEDDVVRVMSIHQSKGLQFPVVFLWSNSKQMAIEFKDLCIFDSDLGIALQHMDVDQRTIRPTILRMAMEHKKDQEELEEEMRILYVATTRAQTQMHMVDCIKSLEDYEAPLSSSVVYQRGGYTSWMLHSALAHESSSLFNIKPVSHLWQSQPQEEYRPVRQTIPQYQGQDIAWELNTPSSIKQKNTLPELSFTQKHAMRHGTMLHTMIEQLPNRHWTETDLQALSASLSSQDTRSLLHLNENHLFQKARTYPQVMHELPFMVKQGAEILHGFMDFVAVGAHEVIIIDFKTDAGKQEAELMRMYRGQLESYASAMKQMMPDKTVRTYIYSLHLHKEIAMDETILV